MPLLYNNEIVCGFAHNDSTEIHNHIAESCFALRLKGEYTCTRDQPGCALVLHKGECINQRKLNIRTTSYGHTNRGHQGCIGRNSTMSYPASNVPNEKLAYKLVDR